ncbi:MAG: hypothetical protein ABSH49_17315 [Bryobacteraceae bacterium]|jgi:hypothetical protein
MRDILRIFDVFSRRPEAPKTATHEIPESTRNRVLLWCRELFSGERPSEIIGRGDHNAEFWQEMYRRLLVRTGRLKLTAHGSGGDPREAVAYVLTCPGVEFLDFLEDIFSNDAFFQVNLGDASIVDELNALLRQDRLPYSLTHFVWEEVQQTSGRFQGHMSRQIRAYPKVIMKESEILHASAIAPALELLSQPHFAGADGEFRAALEDYRKGDIGDCLVKCGSAFEIVLKVICQRKRWPYKQTDTANTLIKTVLTNTSLENYFEPLLIIIATLRNKMSTAHGAGSTPRQVPRHLAQYALNITASAMLMLVQESGA